MIRPLIIIVNLIIVMIIKLLVGTPSSEIKAPSSVKAGEAFLVEVTISTNGETDFMRFSMDIPIGWTVEKVETAGASYKFDKQAAKFLWSRVGEQKEIIISYKITPAADASGEFSLTNKLSHTVDNLPSNIEGTPLKITVTGAETVTTTTVVPDSTAKPSAVITIERQVPTEEVSSTFLVDLIINKEDLTSFGKIEDTLPSGFTANLVKADGGEFKFENGVVKITWFVLPAKHTLDVQYRVTLDPDLQGNQTISGHFSYVENETGKVLAVPASIIRIKPKEAVVVNPIDPNAVVKTNNPTDPNTVVKTNNPDTSGEQTTQAQTNKTNGVDFSVQIAAMNRIVPVSYYKNTFHISGTINTEQIDGLNKYTTGSFSTYQDARNHREEVKGKGVSDAFVTAHNNGKRITVQEALMATSQKWVR